MKREKRELRVHTVRTNDPFEAKRLIHEEEVQRLIKEIIRLKIKCGEKITEDELFGRRWGENAPDVYEVKRPA